MDRLPQTDRAPSAAVSRDATERAADRSLWHAARSQSMASISRDTAHALRDVLNVISMNVELLARAAASGSTNDLQARQTTRCADTARRELRRLDRALDVLLDRHMVERESPETFDMRRVCEALVQLVAPRAARQHVAVSLTGTDTDADVMGYPDRLHAALLGLVINALDAMPNGGLLHVSLARASTLHIHVCDSGPGIRADQLSEIWKAYFTTKPHGTGLGLFVARSIVEAHGGTIHYQPNPNGGSCFIVELPPLPAAVTS